MGYFCTVAFLVLTLYISRIIYIIIVAYFYGICRFLIACTGDMKYCLNRLSHEIETDGKSSIKTRQMIHGIIQFHVDSRQLSEKQFLEIFSTDAL